jgi:predicted nucleotidyltransferase component of viral defense system
MDFTQIRRLVVIAMFSDDVLMERLVLKGGNALELVHRLIDRGSLDIDLAMQDEFEDLDDTRDRIFRALQDRLDSADFIVFDLRFGPRPRVLGPDKPPTWGGYLVEFKLISKNDAERLTHDVERMRRESHTIGPLQQRVFRIDISKYEFCQGKVEAEVDDFAIYVYTPEMCVLEKLRAICQQMSAYKPTEGTRRPRARDFFDIYAAVEQLHMDLATPENIELCRNIFAAKEVPLTLIGSIPEVREFHRPDWDRVRLATASKPRDFDYYFDYVAKLIVPQLKPLWEE